jgi:hypothetical protein
VRSVVVYESVCGNTGQLAHAVADVLAARGSVELVAVGQATSSSVQGADLLAVGAPTHAWGMSWPWTRRIADRSRYRLAQPAIGTREWLRLLGPGHGQAAAAFDTEFESLLGLGLGSRGIARRLRRRGYRLTARPARFFVETTAGPRCHGELGSGPRVGRGACGVDPDVSDNRDQRTVTHPWDHLGVVDVEESSNTQLICGEAIGEAARPVTRNAVHRPGRMSRHSRPTARASKNLQQHPAPHSGPNNRKGSHANRCWC